MNNKELNIRTVSSVQGTTFYYTNDISGSFALVFLPGLTADHTLFDPQVSYFIDKYKLIVLDCPGHGKSRPYNDFTYNNVAEEINSILIQENIGKAIFTGQSLGGMIAQYYIDRYKDKVLGFISIDSVPFGDYYSKSDLFWLMQLEWMAKMFGDKLLRKSMAIMCGTKEETQKQMLEMLSVYSKDELCHLLYVGEAAFIPENKNIDIPCKSILLLGDKDRVGKVASYNKEWAKRTGIPLIIIKDAAHNSNYDQPDKVNKIINDFITDVINNGEI